MKKIIISILTFICLFSSCSVSTFENSSDTSIESSIIQLDESSAIISEDSSVINTSSEPNYILDPTYTPDSAQPHFDMDNEFTRMRTLCESDNAYYFQYFSIPYLYYYDKTSGISGILCGKPDCTHDVQNCNAYLTSQMCGLMWYNNKIYWEASSKIPSENSIFCMNPDGTEMQEIHTLQSETFGFNNMVRIHRDIIFNGVIETTVIDGQDTMIFRLYREELEQDKQDPLLIYEESFNDAGVDFFYQIQGDYLYLALTHYYLTDGLDAYVTLFRYNIKENILENFGETSIGDWLLSDFYIHENSAYITLRQDNEILRLDRFNLTSGQFESVFEQTLSHIHYPSLGEGVVVGYGIVNEVPICTITDYAGTILRTEKLPLPDSQLKEFSIAIMGANQNRVLIALENAREDIACLLEIPTDSTQEIRIIEP